MYVLTFFLSEKLDMSDVLKFFMVFFLVVIIRLTSFGFRVCLCDVTQNDENSHFSFLFFMFLFMIKPNISINSAKLISKWLLVCLRHTYLNFYEFGKCWYFISKNYFPIGAYCHSNQEVLWLKFTPCYWYVWQCDVWSKQNNGNIFR